MPNLWVDSFTTYVYSCHICLLEFTIVIKPKKRYKILTEKCDSYTRKATCKRGQQLPTMLGVVSQQCCVRLHGAKSLTGFNFAQHVTSNNVGSCWSTISVASVCPQPYVIGISLGPAQRSVHYLSCCVTIPRLVAKNFSHFDRYFSTLDRLLQPEVNLISQG